MATGTASPGRALSPDSQVYFRKASIALIGLRGAGKSTLASIIARALNWEVLDTDAIFEQQRHTPIGVFIKQNGWDAFRQAESEILADVLSNNTTEKVIACGGGAIELERNRQLIRQFKEYGLVIHLLREKEDIFEYMRKSDNCEMDVFSWEKTVDLFRECCSFEFTSLTVPLSPSPGKVDQRCFLKPVVQDLFRLLQFIHGVDTNKASRNPGHRTYRLPLTYDDVRHAIPVIDHLSIGIDLWEIRVDLLRSWDLDFLSFQVATLRRHSPLPILFTVRTTSQGGKYPSPEEDDHTAIRRLSALLEHGLRLGVEYLCLEATYPTQINVIIPRLCGNTTILGSYHDCTGSLPWTGPRMWQIYDSIVKMGAGIAQITNTVRGCEDNMSLRQFAASVERGPIPLVAINLGVDGKITQALNTVLSPVSHPLLPNQATSSQITYNECQKVLYLLGLLPPRKYYVFGNSIAHTMSPTIHNTAFSLLSLPYTYEVRATPSVNDLKEVMASPSFGGASVTIPHTRGIIPLLQRLSHNARVIGAVNTITPISGEGLAGDNTDWRAIKTCLLRSLTPTHAVTSSTTALILGAGGSARAAIYALYQVGVINFLIYNRSQLQAQSMAEEFRKLDSLLRIVVLEKLNVPLHAHCPSPTIIVSSTPAKDRTSGDPEPIDLGLNEDHLSPTGGVALELAYDSRTTKLLTLAHKRRAEGYGWTSVEGIDLLLEQAYEQTRIWTGRRAPKSQVKSKVMEIYHQWLAESSPKIPSVACPEVLIPEGLDA